MAKPRKTVEVEALRQKANALFASPTSTPEARAAVFTFVNGFLHATGNYMGFNYLDWLNGGFDRWEADGRPTDTTPYLGDQTRVVFIGRERGGQSKKNYPKSL